jgi:hypothetical protein
LFNGKVVEDKTQTYKNFQSIVKYHWEKKGKKHHYKLETAKIDEALQRLYISQECKKHLMLL